MEYFQECFDKDFESFVEFIDRKNLALADRHYSQFYNERTKEIIARKYQDDIETFGYNFETITPPSQELSR